MINLILKYKIKKVQKKKLKEIKFKMFNIKKNDVEVIF